jgi:hypothetical protein
MKNNDINQVMPQTLNEWMQEEAGNFPAHSNDKPDASVNKQHINARFVPLSQSIFEIKIQRTPIRPAQPHSQPQPQPVDPIMLLHAACVSTTTL